MTIAEKLTSSLPEEYKDGPVVTDFLTAIAPDLQVVQDKIDSLGTILGTDTDDENLDWLLERVGWTIGRHYPNHVKREVLKRQADWDKRYGQIGVIEEMLEVYTRPGAGMTGVSARVEPHPNAGTWTAGFKSFAGKMMVGNHYTRNDLLVTVLNYGSILPDLNFLTRLEGLLGTLLPQWMTYQFDPSIKPNTWTAGYKSFVGKMITTRA
jgi:hypothetical protein